MQLIMKLSFNESRPQQGLIPIQKNIDYLMKQQIFLIFQTNIF